MSSHPKRADHFKEWSRMMLEQALVPDRLEYKRTSKKSVKGTNKRFRKRRKRIQRMRRQRRNRDA